MVDLEDADGHGCLTEIALLAKYAVECFQHIRPAIALAFRQARGNLCGSLDVDHCAALASAGLVYSRRSFAIQAATASAGERVVRSVSRSDISRSSSGVRGERPARSRT